MRRPAVTAAVAAAVLIVAAAVTVDGGFAVFTLFWLFFWLLVAVLVAVVTWIALSWLRWFDFATLVAAAWLALVGTVATVAVPQTAATRADARALEFGYPLRSATSDVSFFSRPSYPQTYGFNPWENPTHFDGLRFALSASIFYALLLGALALGTRLRIYGRRSVRSAGPSA